MKVFTARQAILNRQLNVVGYELLYRDGEKNSFPAKVTPHVATSRMLSRTHFNQGIKNVTGGKIAFINFTEECLLKDFPLLLPKDRVIVEILEDVEPNDAVYKKCAELFKRGYKLALDDFDYNPRWDRFLKFIKIVKFDLSKTSLDDISKIIRHIKKVRHQNNLKNKMLFLAERVENKNEFKQVAKLGFDLFQGYFFCKPEMHQDNDVDLSQSTLFKLYQELCRDELNINRISKYFQTDEGLTYKLLTFINSGMFSLKQPISSIKQALVYLGEHELRKFLTLLTTSLMSKEKPKELLRMGIVRARTCENAAKRVAPPLSGEAFLTGLLSLLPAVLDRPMELILEKLPVCDEIREALTPPKKNEPEGVLRVCLKAAELIEQGSWHLTSIECMKLQLKYDDFCEFHNEAIQWARRYEYNVGDDANEVSGKLA